MYKSVKYKIFTIKNKTKLWLKFVRKYQLLPCTVEYKIINVRIIFVIYYFFLYCFNGRFILFLRKFQCLRFAGSFTTNLVVDLALYRRIFLQQIQSQRVNTDLYQFNFYLHAVSNLLLVAKSLVNPLIFALRHRNNIQRLFSFPFSHLQLLDKQAKKKISSKFSIFSPYVWKKYFINLNMQGVGQTLNCT